MQAYFDFPVEMSTVLSKYIQSKDIFNRVLEELRATYNVRIHGMKFRPHAERFLKQKLLTSYKIVVRPSGSLIWFQLTWREDLHGPESVVVIDDLSWHPDCATSLSFKTIGGFKHYNPSMTCNEYDTFAHVNVDDLVQNLYRQIFASKMQSSIQRQ